MYCALVNVSVEMPSADEHGSAQIPKNESNAEEIDNFHRSFAVWILTLYAKPAWAQYWPLCEPESQQL